MCDSELDLECEEYIASSKKTVLNMMSSQTLMNGPVYLRYNRMLASLYLQLGKDYEAIFHLSESHAVTLRNSALKMSIVNKDEQKNSNNLPRSLWSRDYFSFCSLKFQNGPAELRDQLKILPSEWTLVQLTFEYDEHETSFKTSDTKMLPLHVTRLPCGKMLSKKRMPVTVTVPEMDNSNAADGCTSILEQVHQCIRDNHTAGASVQEKRSKRANADQRLKQIVGEVITSWLKEWSCLLIGRLMDSRLEQSIVNEVDRLMQNYKRSDENVMDVEKVRNILYQIVDCCAHSSESYISSAVEYCVGNKSMSSSFIESILNFKKTHTTALMRAARHPVLLILDDRLECIPWEMTSVLLKHPVSRVPSLHFACALFEKHRDKIVNGVMLVDETKSGFYIINPDKDLVSTEKSVNDFIKKRKLEWLGVAGQKPSHQEVIRSLHENKVFLYCGHGNGCHILNFNDLEKTHLTVIPMLFGCSSASKKRIGEGGLPELWGVSDQYLLAGSPCFFGMLWSVFNTPTNVLTLAFLNMCLPGTPINVNEVIGQEVIDEYTKQEPELLRALRPTKSAIERFMNAAAFIARGIPVAFRYTTTQLIKDLKEWEFSPSKLLRFPLDPIEQNFVRRNVKTAVFSRVDPTPLNNPRLISFSENVITNILNMHVDVTKTKEFVEFIAGNNVLKSSVPIAHRYGGHQFGYWAMQLGDGRAILLGEYINRAGAIIVSDDLVMRDLLYDGHPIMEKTSVVLRIAQSWFRFGSFEILAKTNETNILRDLVNFIIKEHYPDINPDNEDKVVELFSHICRLTTDLLIHWQTIGFVHGVLNTDNMSVLGITIDYGPFGFMEEFDPLYKSNESDHDRRYCYTKQVEIVMWNLMKLLQALTPLLTETQSSQAFKILETEAKNLYPKLNESFSQKLGLKNRHDELIELLFEMMEGTRTDFTMLFRQMSETPMEQLRQPKTCNWAVHKLATHSNYQKFYKEYSEKLESDGVTDEERMNKMRKRNPRYVLRNWMAQEAIEIADKNDDFTEVNRLLRVLSKPFEEQAEAEERGYAQPPPNWSKRLKLSCSS
ncbi:hypothetical protein LSTR_LSTR001366 [Laodelphax striatellus]|uniref:Selenoprotein O n=1 Tax=Laodelphax striatellus TaxID=195883 RepID=A0A482XB99_LAOST|nr:hypothetical protein LSTR_LSTR001366 [Laodelphax striatellus]